MILFFLGAIGFLVCLIIFVVKLIIKRPKKAIGILTGVFFGMTIIGMIIAMNTPAIETVPANYKKIMNGEMNGKIVDLVGDVEKIETVGELYVFKIKTSDGEYEAYTTKDVAGTFPQEGDKRVKMYVTPDYTDDGQLSITILSFRE